MTGGSSDARKVAGSIRDRLAERGVTETSDHEERIGILTGASFQEATRKARCSLMDCGEPAAGFHGSHQRVTADGWESTQTPFCTQHLALAAWLTYGCR